MLPHVLRQGQHHDSGVPIRQTAQYGKRTCGAHVVDEDDLVFPVALVQHQSQASVELFQGIRVAKDRYDNGDFRFSEVHCRFTGTFS